jgi:hypothetical protein
VATRCNQDGDVGGEKNDNVSNGNHDDFSSDRGNYGSVLSNESESSAQATFENQNLQTAEEQGDRPTSPRQKMAREQQNS